MWAGNSGQRPEAAAAPFGLKKLILPSRSQYQNSNAPFLKQVLRLRSISSAVLDSDQISTQISRAMPLDFSNALLPAQRFILQGSKPSPGRVESFPNDKSKSHGGSGVSRWSAPPLIVNAP